MHPRSVEWASLMIPLFCRPSSGHILEALHVDPASGVSLDKEKNSKLLKPPARYDRDCGPVVNHAANMLNPNDDLQVLFH